MLGVDMGTYASDTEVITPDLAARGFLQQFRFKGGFAVYA
jgi:hypothetical protein